MYIKIEQLIKMTIFIKLLKFNIYKCDIYKKQLQFNSFSSYIIAYVF